MSYDPLVHQEDADPSEPHDKTVSPEPTVPGVKDGRKASAPPIGPSQPDRGSTKPAQKKVHYFIIHLLIALGFDALVFIGVTAFLLLLQLPVQGGPFFDGKLEELIEVFFSAVAGLIAALIFAIVMAVRNRTQVRVLIAYILSAPLLTG
jgi:hypothetical protein